MFILFGFAGSSLFAQIGMTANSPAKSAVLDLRVSGTNKGLLLPQVSLTSLSVKSPVIDAGTTDTSLMVYNTNPGLPGGTGYYYWNGNQWVKLVAGVAGNKADNLGNHTATMALDLKVYNVNNVDKLSTQTTSIAKGVNGTAAVAGAVLTAGDANGNLNWVVPQKPRTFFWKGTSTDNTYYPLVKPAASMSWTEFDGNTYTAPADGVLEVALVMYASMGTLGQNNFDGTTWQSPEYAVGSILLQPMANNVAVPNSAVKSAFTVYNQVIGYGASRGRRQAVYLTTVFPVTKGTVYSFKITVAGEASQPGDLPTTNGDGVVHSGQYNEIRFSPPPILPDATDFAYHILQGVFYPNP